MALRTTAVWNEDRLVEIGNEIEVAHNFLSRAVGLLGRSSLTPGQGLWIRPCSGVHTFCMNFAIDLIGLSKDLRVISLIQNVKPNRIAGVSWKIHSILELPAQTIARTGTQPGDWLSMRS